MKWQARSRFSREERKVNRRWVRRKWHRCFAWLPASIPETKCDEIVVPRHYVWLEYVARKSRDNDGLRPWIYKPYVDELTINQLAELE